MKLTKRATQFAILTFVTIFVATTADSLRGLHAAEQPEWAKNALWSWGDQGFVEPEVQKDLEHLDVVYKKSMLATCVRNPHNPAGRACVMQVFACDAAKHKFDHMAWEMTIATQRHNPHAAETIRQAGETTIANWIRGGFAQCR